MNRDKLKGRLLAVAEKEDLEFMGFAQAAGWCWSGLGKTPAQLYPPAKTIIVLGLPLWLPLIEPSPSIFGKEQLIITQKLLETAVYRISLVLLEEGCGFYSVPRTELLAAGTGRWFYEDAAGQLAGLGSTGWSHRILTVGFGPRLQLKVLLTDAELAAGGGLGESSAACRQCGNCRRICPVGALTSRGKDWAACAAWQHELDRGMREPCGFCMKVCPVGRDRELFQSQDCEIYFREQQTLKEDCQAMPYAGWEHIRSYGSFPRKSR